VFQKILEKYKRSRIKGMLLDERVSKGEQEAIFLRYVVELFNRAIKIKPEYVAPYYNMAYLYKDIGEYETSKRMFDEYIRRDPFDYEAHLYLGEVYQMMDDPKEAIKEYEKSISLASEYQDVYLMILVNLNNAVNGPRDTRIYKEACKKEQRNPAQGISLNKKRIPTPI